ncbi:MAG: beta-L-arabinofuranosidase domain-containing protein [Bryobacteraceae bacterium]
MLTTTVLSTVLVLAAAATGAPVEDKVHATFQAPANTRFEFGGVVGTRLKANLENWELRAPVSNPALVQMFYDRDRKPSRNLLPWSGEFIGKYLCSSILSYRALRNPRQKRMIDRLTASLIGSQGPDGYLGPFDRENRLTGKNWDIWGHYWAIRALLLYHEEFGSKESLDAATRAADLLAAKFLDKDFRFTNDGSFGQMNYSVIHAFTQLYRMTGKPSYLAMANWIVKEWDRPGAGLYMRMALAGREMFEFPGNRWESLHDFLGMSDMYFLTGEAKYRQAFEHIWYSILRGDRHNTGGFTSGERTTGNPYDGGAIETCCTVAWIDMSIEMLRLTGDSMVADELELSTLNGMIGGQHPSGNWWTYNTPMDGVKEASAHSIHFQCRPGSPELNCCSVNGPRGMALVTQWAVLRAQDGVALNYYGPSKFEIDAPSGQRLIISQASNYPRDGRTTIRLSLAKPEQFTLRLRVPAWSNQTRVVVNGQRVAGVRPGTYLALDRKWSDGSVIVMDLDFSPHYWVGEREADGKTSVYRGPILLAFDPFYNVIDLPDIPEMDARDLRFAPESSTEEIQPWVLVAVKADGGKTVKLCDFATAGAYGNPYRTWLPMRNVSPVPFDRARPVWNNRPVH